MTRELPLDGLLSRCRLMVRRALWHSSDPAALARLPRSNTFSGIPFGNKNL